MAPISQITTVTRRCAGAALLLCAVAIGCAAQPRETVTIAAAANLTEAFRAIGARFESETGIHPVFSFASTAQLTQQARNGAPFDVIAAADTVHIDQLERAGLLAGGSKAIYARGSIALWIPPGSRAAVKSLEDLAGPNVRMIAIAKPELAPYGQAAVDVLQRAGLWERVRSRVVYAENVNMARQYGVSGNADAVITAYPLLVTLRDGGSVVRIDSKLHTPIDQALGILARSPHPATAHKFTEFLLGGAGRDIMRHHGYDAPVK